MRFPKLGRDDVQPVSLSNERSMFMQADMDPSNFGVDEQGNTVIMDFEQICSLPESFVVLAMGSERLDPVVKHLGLSNNSNTYSMARISGTLWMTADTSLGALTCEGISTDDFIGLNDDGYPKTS